MGVRKSFAWRCSVIAVLLCALNGYYLTNRIVATGGPKPWAKRPSSNRSVQLIGYRLFDLLSLPLSAANLTALWSSHPQPAAADPPPPTPAPPRLPQYHAVTYASHHGSDERFCMALESAARHGVRLTILGWGVPWRGLFQERSLSLSRSSPSLSLSHTHYLFLSRLSLVFFQ